MPNLTDVQMRSNLLIRDLSLFVNIGASEAERSMKQQILLDIEISWKQVPSGCFSDSLGDVVCYQTLIESIHQFVGSKRFSLVEHFSYVTFQFIKSLIPPCSLLVKVNKNPAILDQSRNISFTICDL